MTDSLILKGELVLTDEGTVHSVAVQAAELEYLGDAILQHFVIELDKGRWRWRLGGFRITVEKLEDEV